ncbi:MAG TPA: histidine phosphatase family protein [Mariprofundaceae bacterium]|nr:histidine phosphatase family protein [Mariprofundaceae bacterium]
MKRLLLVRHAKSSWKDAGLDDFDRPLNKRGVHDAPMMGSRLAKRHIHPDMIVSSPAKRAVQTAEALAASLKVPAPRLICDRSVYEASTATLLKVIEGFDDEKSCVMLVGHNPAMTLLANALAGHVIDNLPTCGIVDLSIDIERWRDVAGGDTTCRLCDYPKREGT